MTGRSFRVVAAWLGGVAAVAAVAVAAVAVALRRSSAGARDLPLSPLHGDRRIGASWPDERAIRGDRVPGEMDSLAAYARPGFDPDGVHPDVRALYERTGEFEMTLSATWHRPFRLGARLAGRWTTRIQQLNLPGPDGRAKRVASELFALAGPAAAADPREDPRLWVRTDVDADETVFVAVYASHTVAGERYVNIAVPLPRANLATVLRMRHRGDGLELTSDCPGGGLYLHTNLGAFRLPASQVFRVSPAGDPDAPSPPAGVDGSVVDGSAVDGSAVGGSAVDGVAVGGDTGDVLAEQRIRLFGVPLVTVRYAAVRA